MYSQNTNWSLGTAYSLKEGQWETGLFQPLRYGINNNMDVAAHPFLAAIIPNIMIKRTPYHYHDIVCITLTALDLLTDLVNKEESTLEKDAK